MDDQARVKNASTATCESLVRRMPRYGWIGLLLIASSWPAYWIVSGAYSEDLFVPLWAGYVLVADGLGYARTGGSLLTGPPARWLALLAAGGAFWFSFEIGNHVMHDWTYLTHARHGRLTFDLVQAATFATVGPVLWVTTAFYRTIPRLAELRGPRAPRLAPAALGLLSVAGAVCLAAPMLWPRAAFTLVWFGWFLLLDPLNAALGGRSLIRQAEAGRWGTWLALTLAALTAGVFWEGWNNGSAGYMWTYHVPYFDSAPHLFQMPLPGYLGYPPFVYSAYAAYQSGVLIVRRARRLKASVRLD
jgi:hypothetical protein